mmetsp:Transcript_40613/g.60232  ORF Transcript_40613/g.60232 Transcript_40613/m.60232 type:complete len:83 (+) Transcript_40613:712-960(+)
MTVGVQSEIVDHASTGDDEENVYIDETDWAGTPAPLSEGTTPSPTTVDVDGPPAPTTVNRTPAPTVIDGTQRRRPWFTQSLF